MRSHDLHGLSRTEYNIRQNNNDGEVSGVFPWRGVKQTLVLKMKGVSGVASGYLLGPGQCLFYFGATKRSTYHHCEEEEFCGAPAGGGYSAV